MKKQLHPQYFADAKITCLTCGAVYEIGSTRESYSIPVCRNCHPFYTGETQTILDSANTISSFNKKFSKSQDLQKKLQEIKKQREERQKTRVGVIASSEKRTALKDLLNAAKTQGKKK